MLRRLLKDTSGATVIEYSVLIAAIGLAVVIGFKTVGDSINFLFADNASKMREIYPGTPPDP